MNWPLVCLIAFFTINCIGFCVRGEKWMDEVGELIIGIISIALLFVLFVGPLILAAASIWGQS